MNHYKNNHIDDMAKNISKNETVTLTARDWKALIKALDNADKPKPKLAAAIRQYREWQRRVLVEARR